LISPTWPTASCRTSCRSNGRPRPPAQEKAEAHAAQDARGAAAWVQRNEGQLSRQELKDMSRHLDPAGRAERSKRRYR